MINNINMEKYLHAMTSIQQDVFTCLRLIINDVDVFVGFFGLSGVLKGTMYTKISIVKQNDFCTYINKQMQIS